MLKTHIPPNASVTETREPIILQEEFKKGAHTISAVREQAQPGTLADFSAFFHLLLAYRVPMMVRDAMLFRHFPDPFIYYHCPPMSVASGKRIYGILFQMRPMLGLARLQES